MYYEYLVDVDMVSVEWLQSIVSGPPAIIQQAKEKLHMAIAALSRNSGEAEQQQQEGSNTIKNFARTTMLTRMINGYLALEAASDTPVVCGPVVLRMSVLSIGDSCVCLFLPVYCRMCRSLHAVYMMGNILTYRFFFAHAA